MNIYIQIKVISHKRTSISFGGSLLLNAAYNEQQLEKKLKHY